MYNFKDRTDNEQGTWVNRRALMAIQGFFGTTTVFNQDGSITETNQDGDVLVTTFNQDGSITETFTSGTGATAQTIIKTTTFNQDGSITEVISQ